MFTRFMLCVALGIQSAFTLAHAANDLEKWNSEKGRVARSAMKDKLSTTSYRELPNHVDSSYRSTANGGKVLKQLETNAQVKGSRVGATIEALKDVDKMGAAKKFAKELGKGAVRFTAGAVLIEAAMDELLDGVDWVMDPENNTVQKPNPEANVDNSKFTSANKFIPSSSGFGDWVAYSHSGACSKYKENFKDTSYTLQSVSPYVINGSLICRASMKSVSSGATSTMDLGVLASPNPYYDPNFQKPPSHVDVSEAEMIEKIREYFENPQSPQSKDLLIEDAVKPKGKAKIMWSDDPASEQIIQSDNKNTAEKVLNSDDPVGDGLTKDVPKLSDGTSVDSETTTNTETNTNVNEHTVTNPDGSTTTTGTNTSNTTNITNNNFDLPSFCDYASKLCDWLDWTKEEPETEEEQEQQTINDKGIFDRKFDIKFELEKNCPPDKTIQFETKYIAGTYVFSFNWLCIFFNGIAYPLVFLSHCLGAWIFYEIAVRRGNQGA